jgi:Ribophorin I
MWTAARILVGLLGLAVLCSGQVVNKDVTRTIDASSAIVRITADIKAVNVAGEYQVAFPTNEAKSLSFISVALKDKMLPLSAPVR